MTITIEKHNVRRATNPTDTELGGKGYARPGRTIERDRRSGVGLVAVPRHIERQFSPFQPSDANEQPADRRASPEMTTRGNLPWATEGSRPEQTPPMAMLATQATLAPIVPSASGK